MSSNPETYLRLQRAALLFLDQTGTLSNICLQCSTQKETGHTYHFTVPVDPSELVDLDVMLGNAFLNHPTAASKIFQEVVFSMAETLNLLPECTSPTQIVIRLKATHLPSLPCYQLPSFRSLIAACTQTRLLQYYGIICSISTTQSYTKSARYVCCVEGCPGAEGNHYIRVHVPGAKEEQTVRTDFRCTFCCSLLEEDMKCRVLSDRMIVHIVDQGVFQHGVTDYPRHQALAAVLRDELSLGIEVGQAVTVIGIPVYDQIQASLALEVNNIIQQSKPWTPQPENPRDPENIPDTLKYLYLNRGSSPWSFTLSLAYAFGSGVTADGTFLHLKLGILLCLVGITHTKLLIYPLINLHWGSQWHNPCELKAVVDLLPNQRTTYMCNWIHFAVKSHSISSASWRGQFIFPTQAEPWTQYAHFVNDWGGRGLDMLVVGEDILLLSRLLQFGARLSQRLITHSGTNPLTAALSKGRDQSVMIDGGSLLLANGGVCLLPDLNMSKKGTKQSLKQVLETSRVCVDIPERLSNKGCGYQLFYPLRCQVWAVSDLPFQHRPQYSEDPESLPQENVKVDQQLDSVFGMVYFCNVKVDSYPDYLMVDRTLMKAAGFHTSPLITNQDFVEFLNLARQRDVSFTSAAELLIKGYYMASRQARATGVKPSNLPQTAVATISSLACCHAKLRLGETVDEEDAVLAILLYEESATHRFGRSPLSVKPLVHIEDNNLQAYIGAERDDKMQLFKHQLQRYIAVYAGDVNLEE